MRDNISSSREIILKKVREGKPKEIKLPDVPLYSYPGNSLDSFISNLKSFDGNVIEFASRNEAIEWLENNIDRNNNNIFSAIVDYHGNKELSDFKTPHEAHVVDIAIGEGVLGVAETGSVWVTEESLGLTAAALFSTDLYILLDKKSIKSGLHEAYKNIDLAKHQYGAFYTGPSATADIEAVHVTGAQGEISLTVLLF